ncbi:CapA family protein [Aliihoeflea sp. 40Bstr573]|uniref:CapA family protein n=1 Tax=Aliihoeflea sp. 40Bstr573 TaxID=2696467 RepID=UPI00209558B5|nr:CapA family protein [Aliihoeflea sp. 40Bstr573]MCO6386972.1 hypothetical protein [Aliihoeflea sp. 40Bstr573]
MSYSLTCTGDLIMTGPFLGPEGPRKAVYGLMGAADHCFVNLEMPLTLSSADTDKTICLKAPPSLAHDLRALGVDVVNFANNHAMDYAASGLADTLAALKEAGISQVGAGLTLAESLAPVSKTAGRTKVAFMGLTTTLPNGSGAGPNRPGVAPIRVLTRYVIDPVAIQETPGMSPFAETFVFEGDQQTALNAVRAAAADNDIVIVAIHWGVPFGWVAASQDELADYQRPLGRALIDAGASAVIGHHPHYLQGVEFHSGKPIIYSLGNFTVHNVIPDGPGDHRSYPAYSFESLQSELTRIGAVARLTWADSAGLPNLELIPVYLNSDGEGEIASREVAERARAQVAKSSRKLNSDAKLRFDGDVPLIDIVPR